MCVGIRAEHRLWYRILTACIASTDLSSEREERRRSTWRTRAPGNIPYEYGDSAFGPHLEKLNSSDAKVLNSVHGTRLRGESVSKKSKLGNRSRSSQTRESELWGSGEDLGASSYVMPDPYKEREKSLYEDLDFGPAVMSSLADPHPAVPSLPPIAHLSEPGRRISVHGVNGLGPNGWERTNIMTDENQSLDRNPSLTRVKNKPTLSKSKTTSDKNHARKIPKPHLATSSSMNQLDEVSEREFDREQLRRKKDTIAGLTEAYGNANGWGEVERESWIDLMFDWYQAQAKLIASLAPVDPMPPDLYALQSYTLQNPSTHTSDHPIKSNPVARSKTLAAQNINLDPLSPAPHQPGSDSSLMQPTMRLSQASKELEEMVKFPYHEHPHPSNHSPTPLYPQDSSAMGMARSVSPFDHTFSPSSFHPSPQLGYFPPLPIPPSTTPKILGHTNGTFVEPPTRAPSVYSQSGHVSNYTAPISHPAGLTPGQHSAHPPDTHLRKKESQWQEAVMTHPGFGVSQAVQAKPTFSLPDLKHDPNSPRFTDLFPDFQSQPSPDPFSGPCLRSDPLIRSDSRNRDELDPKETKTIHQSGHSHQDAYHGIQSYPLQEFLNSDPNQKEFPSLSQMNVERLNQDYHSPTYSIYGMYNSPTQQTKV